MSETSEGATVDAFEEAREAVDRPVWTLLTRYGRPHAPLLAVSLVPRFLSVMYQPIPYFLIGVAFDTVFVPTRQYRLPLVPDAWIPSGQIPQLWFTFWLLVIVGAIIPALNLAVRDLTSNVFSHRLMHDVRVDVYDTVQRFELAFFDAQPTGEVMSVLNDDVDQLGNVFTSGISTILNSIGRVIGLFLLMALINWQLMLVTLAVAPLYVVATYRYGSMMRSIYGDIRASVGELNARLQNNVSGIGVIKAYVTEEFERERVADASETYLRTNLRQVVADAKYNPAVSLTTNSAFILTFVVGGYWIIRGPPLFFTMGLTPGALITFLIYSRRVSTPLRRVTGIINVYENAQASARRILGMEAAAQSLTEPDDPVLLDDVAGAVEYDHVTFGYPGRPEPAIRDVSLDVDAGEVIGLVGPTGAGKSTLTKLLMRLYDVDEGAVRIDGVDVRDAALSSLRRSIGYVSQDPFLFSGSVRENVAYGDPGADDDAIVEAAKLAGAHEFVVDLPDGYDTVVGERGIKLSGGQRQRVSIARAFLRDPPILVLDEATSHVDNETEALIQQGIESLIQDRTAFVIAHRLSTVQDADRILVLDDGEIAERGTHEELLDADGLYANLWNVQVGDVDSLSEDFLERVARLEEQESGRG